MVSCQQPKDLVPLDPTKILNRLVNKCKCFAGKLQENDETTAMKEVDGQGRLNTILRRLMIDRRELATVHAVLTVQQLAPYI